MKISVKVLPNAGKNQVVENNNGVWRIKINAQPEKGKANKALIEFLSKTLKIKKNQLEIISGETSHNKIIEITGPGEAEIAAALQQAAEK